MRLELLHWVCWHLVSSVQSTASCYILAAGGRSYLVTQRLFCTQQRWYDVDNNNDNSNHDSLFVTLDIFSLLTSAADLAPISAVTAVKQRQCSDE